MTFAGGSVSSWSRVALLVGVGLLLLSACDGNDESGSAEDGQPDTVAESQQETAPSDENDNDDNEVSSDDPKSKDEDSKLVEGATTEQQSRIDSGRPTILIRAPENGAEVESPVQMRFEVLNAELVESSADDDGYVIFVKAGRGSQTSVYKETAEIPLTELGRTKVMVSLGDRRGLIRSTTTSITVDVTQAEGTGGAGSGG
jgi:hypothetical protein